MATEPFPTETSANHTSVKMYPALYKPQFEQQPVHFSSSPVQEQPPAPMDPESLRRISVVSWAVVTAIAASLFLRLPTFVLSFQVLGSPFTLTIRDTTLMAFFIAALAGSGAESVIRSHPRFRHRDEKTYKRSRTRGHGRTWSYWALPSALSILSVLLLPLAPTRIFQVVVTLVGGLCVTLSLFSLYATVDTRSPGFRRDRILLNVLAYGAALALFLLVYQTRTRSLFSGTLVAATAALLAAELLRTTTDEVDLVMSYAAIVGLILGEVTWALNYWLPPGLTGGLLLLLIFYLTVGIAQQGLQERLNRRVLLEFFLFAVLALILIAVVGPGF